MREPSCTHNHDVMRREIRDKGLESVECPSCGWLLKPSREEPDLLSDRVERFMDWLQWETDFFNGNDYARTEVQKKLIEFLT